MLCYRDMTFCAAKCATHDCPRQFNDTERARARAWWGKEDAPVAFSDFSAHCPDFTASVDGRRMAETTEELARGVARPARSARQAPRRPTLPSQTPAEESNND